MGYIPHSAEETAELLKTIGKKDVAELFAHLPPEVLKNTAVTLPAPRNEYELSAEFKRKARLNKTTEHFCGLGLYKHRIPVTVDALAGQRSFVTSYTPYQPEVAQGTLQVLFEYQSLMASLTAMDVANASLYDGATALVEAIRMALRQDPHNDIKNIVISEGVQPQYRDVIDSYFPAYLQNELKIKIQYVPLEKGTGNTLWPNAVKENTGIIVLQTPNFSGITEKTVDLKKMFPGSRIIYVTTEALSLTILDSPGIWSADIVCGEAQSLGMNISFGGPGLGFIAAKDEFKRQMPGRLIGKTTAKDGFGNDTSAYVITLATREQHIRREKATSNICSNQTLMAIRAAVFMASQGWKGMQEQTAECIRFADIFKSELIKRKKDALVYADGINFHEVLWESTRREQIFEKCETIGFTPGIRINKTQALSYFSEETDIHHLQFLADLICE